MHFVRGAEANFQRNEQQLDKYTYRIEHLDELGVCPSG